MVKKKNCFIICPIGKPDSDERKRSDSIFHHIIQPVLSQLGYDAIRADKIEKSGNITHQIIERLINDDLVIADLTGHNANVFYELAIRHCIKKPYIQMIQKGETIPFDLNQERTIEINYPDWDSIITCKENLKNYILENEKNPEDSASPITSAINLIELNKSENPSDKRQAEMMNMMETLISSINNKEDRDRWHTAQRYNTLKRAPFSRNFDNQMQSMSQSIKRLHPPSNEGS